MTDNQSNQKTSNRTKVSYSAADYRHFQIKLLMRLSMVLCFIMVFINIALGLSLIQISSSLKVNAVVLTKQDSSGKMVVVDPVTADMINTEAIKEVMLRNYINIRHTIINNDVAMSQRWGIRSPLRWMSSDDVYKAFYVNANAFRDRLRDIHNNPEKAQEVDIIDIRKLANNLWNIDFDVITYNSFTGISTRQRLNASVRASVSADYVRTSGNFLNPLGFVVTEYNEAQKIVK